MRNALIVPRRVVELGAFPRFSKQTLTVPLAALQLHMLIMGGSGRGKSKLLEHILRALLRNRLGFEFHDPHGDTADAIIEFMAVNPGRVVPQDVIAKTVYVEPGRLDNSVSFDVFAQYSGKRYDDIEYIGWLETTVRHVELIVQKLQGDDDMAGMARLGRWLRGLLICAGIAIDNEGTHLGLPDALVALTPHDERHGGVFARLAPRLRQLFPDVYYDVCAIRSTKRTSDQERWTESTVNRFRQLITSPAVCFMTGQYRASLNVKDLYQQNCPVILNLRPSDKFSRDQAIAVSGLWQHCFDQVARKTPEHERTERFVVLDEMEHFLDGSTRDTLGEGRKFKRSLIGCVQDATCLRNEKHDHLSKFVSQAGVVISFQQKAPDDLDYLGEFFATPNLDFTPLTHVVDRPLQRWIFAPTLSFGHSDQTGLQIGRSKSVTDTISGQRTETLTASESDAVTKSQQHATGRNWADSRGRAYADTRTSTWSDSITESEGRSTSLGQSENESASLSNTHSEGSSLSDSNSSQHGDGRSSKLFSSESDVLSKSSGVSRSLVQGQSSSDSNSQQQTHGRSRSLTNGQTFGTARARSDGGSFGTTHTDSFSQTDGGSETKTHGTAHQVGHSRGRNLARGLGLSHAVGDTFSAGVSKSQGVNQNVSYSLQHVTLYRQEQQPTGKLLRSVPDQIAMVRNVLATLPMAHVLVRCNDTQTFLLRIATLLSSYELAGPRLDLSLTAAMRRRDLERFKQRLFKLHAFCFSPLLVEKDATSIERFLGTTTNRPIEHKPSRDGSGQPKTSPNGNGHKPPRKRIAGGLIDDPGNGRGLPEEVNPEELIG